MSPPTNDRFNIVIPYIATVGLTSEHGIDGFTSCTDHQDPFALFLQLETCRKGGSLKFNSLQESKTKGGICSRLFCVPLPMNE
jgi:hypothetical protein